MSTPKLPDASGYVIPLILVLVLVLVVKGAFKNLFSGFGDLGEALNIKDTQEEKTKKKKVDADIKKIEDDVLNNPFNKNMYASFPGKKIHTLNAAAAARLPGEIKDSIGGFYDEPLRILNAFKTIQYKTAVSHLSKLFSVKYNRDLFEYLQKNLDTTDQKIILGKIINYVNALPLGVEK